MGIVKNVVKEIFLSCLIFSTLIIVLIFAFVLKDSEDDCKYPKLSEGNNEAVKRKILRIFEDNRILAEDSIYKFRLDTIANFQWDDVLIFGGYEKRQDIDYVLGYNWKKCFNEIDEHGKLLIFLSKEKLVSHVYLGRNEKHEYDPLLYNFGNHLHNPNKTVFLLHRVVYDSSHHFYIGDTLEE